MAAQDKPSFYTKRLEWSGHAHSSVICTGDFDEWKGTQPLSKDSATSKWTATVKVPYGQKDVKYKFLVDGTWQHATDQQFINDDAGNTNNVFSVPEGPSDEDAAAEAASTQAETSQADGETSLTTATSDQEGERDIPKTIQDLFSNTSSGDFLGPGLGGMNGGQNGSIGANGGGPFQHPNFITYNMANFGTSKYIPPLQQHYPSKYLLETVPRPEGAEEKETTPTDTQIACEYILAKYKSVHAQAQNRVALQKEMEEEKKIQEKNEKDGAEDKKLLEVEEGAKEDSTTSEDNKVTSGSAKTTKNKALPAIQVPGIAKIYSTIKESHPHWVFSEKRLRKIIKEGEEAAAVISEEGTKESAMLEADRIVKLAGLMGSGKYANDLVPISRFDTVLQQELDDQWAATNGLPLPSASASSSSASIPSTSQPTLNGEDKENEQPSSSTKSKKKKNAAKTTATDAASAVVNGIAEGAEALVNKVATSLPPSSITNAVASTSSSATLAALTAAPTKRNPTNAVGDVALKWYGPIKGRGVVARRKFKKGSIIFREDAFAFAPVKSIQNAINEGRGCAFCGKLFSTKAQALVVPCTAHDHLPTATAGGKKVSLSSGARKVSSGAVAKTGANAKKEKGAEGANEEEADAKSKKVVCNAKFCNKLCRERATETYANLLCPVVNPSYATFLRWAESADPRAMKMNPTGVFYIMLRLIVAASKPTPGAADEAIELMRRIECLAAVNERSRRAKELHMLADMQYGHDWVLGYRFVMEALQLPDHYYEPATLPNEAKGQGDSSTDDDEKGEDPSRQFFPGATLKRSDHGGINALPEWYRNLKLPEEMEAKLLGLDNYLVWLGRVALNQEDDGGVYMLHPCMNHECQPNATVRRTPAINGQGAREAKPSRIFVLATKDIEEGEEITVMYVNPNSHVSLRQSHLKTDYLFECACALCREQLQQIEQQQNDSNKAAITSNGEAGDISATAADTSVASAADEEDASDVIALAFKAPPGATVDESYASRLKASAARNGSAGHTNGHVNGESDGAADVNGDGEAAGRVKLSAATIKKKKKKAAAKLRQEQEAAEAAAKAHALDPMGFFSSNKPSTPWYEEDDM